MREAGTEDDLELEALGLVHGQHLDRRLAPGAGRLGVVGGPCEKSIQRAGDVAQQGRRPVEPLVHSLDRLEPFDRRAQVADGFRSLVGRETEVEEAAHGAVLDEDRVGEAGQRQPRNAAEQAVTRDHRGVQAVELLLREMLEIVRLGASLARRLASPRQWIAHGVSRREHVHEAAHHACQRAALLAGMGAEPAESSGADPAKT